ncbi:chaplin [Streptomyces sp. AK02-01A]|uniref:chaplin n=1 Tax=Streptomyces sp. AK02-01A TaxID=3028648 RepID=UPI0029BCB91E|nr:chaplin [Streptomyces sp. AK02-01A]MDX3850523.1 chaplin [Streptomyces sp. AK02-01A]
MRQVTRKGLITVAAAGGVLALGGGYAHADSEAGGTAANSPGVLSGNNIQVPVHVPVNVCGNTVNVVGLLNPALGNSCANTSDNTSGNGGLGGDGDGGGYGGSHSGGSLGGGSHAGGSHTGGGAVNSPGIGSGNSIELPIDLPVNACGNGVSVVGLGTPVTGSDCENESPVVTPPVTPEQPAEPVTPEAPAVVPPAPEPQTAAPQELAHTGAGSLGIAIPAAAGLLLAGSVIYRRSRAAA